MYNSTVDSIGCGSLDYFETVYDFDDLAFMTMVMSMQETDHALAAKMKEIRGLNRLKKSLADRIGILNDAIIKSGAKKDKDRVYLAGTLQDPEGYAPPAVKPGIRPKNKEGRDFTKGIGFEEKKTLKPIPPDQNQNVGAVQGEPGEKPVYENHGPGDPASDKSGHGARKSAGTTVEEDPDTQSPRSYKKKEVENQIEKLRAELDDLNSSSEVMMIDLQRLMNKRSQAVQLVSNMESRSHKTAMSIISHFS